jgi:hypothetical protein
MHQTCIYFFEFQRIGKTEYQSEFRLQCITVEFGCGDHIWQRPPWIAALCRPVIFDPSSNPRGTATSLFRKSGLGRQSRLYSPTEFPDVQDFYANNRFKPFSKLVGQRLAGAKYKSIGLLYPRFESPALKARRRSLSLVIDALLSGVFRTNC